MAEINHQAGFLLLKKIFFPFCGVLSRHRFISSTNMKKRHQVKEKKSPQAQSPN